MFSLAKPTEQRIRALLAQQQTLGCSYAEVGATRGALPRGYTVDHNRVYLGAGSATFARAVEALRCGQMFAIAGLQLYRPSAALQPGSVVAVLAKHFGFWSLNFCRIVYVVDEHAPVKRYGFAYGTLPEHAARGEERFTVEWNISADSVWYDVLAFSRPGNLLVRAAYPLARLVQKRFARKSLQAAVQAVRG